MERLSYRDRFLLGYSPQRYFENPNSSPRAFCRHSDLDFHDVFGGPPRRSSLHEKHHDIGESQESYAIEGREETFFSRNSCPALNEKPVFGGGNLNRRRYPSDEFFDDIFRTDESLSSTPSKHDRDPFSSMPASCIPSPARPLPPKAEPFGGSPAHAQFSLPAKLAKGMEFLAVSSPYRNKDSFSSVIGSPSSPSVSVCGTLNQAVQGQEDSINDVRLFYRESLLSHDFSISRDMPLEATNSDKQDTGGNLKKASSGSRVSINSNQFHFSIYKWAGQGVPLVMPLRDGNNLRSKERKSDKGSSTNESYEVHSKESKLPAPVMLGVKLPIFNEKASENNRSPKFEGGNQDNYLPPNAVTQERDNSSRFTERSVPSIYKPEHQSSIQSIITEVSSNLILHDDAKENKVCSGVSHAPPDRVNSGVSHAHPDLEKEELISTQEVHKNGLESHYSLSYNNNDGQGENDFGRHARMEEMKTFNLSSENVDSGRNIKRKNRKAIISNPVDATSSTFQTPSINSEDKFFADRVKGKVKDFVKIFDQEFPSKAIADIDTRSWSSRWKNKSIAVDETSDHATKEDGKEQIMVNANKTSTDTPIMVGELLKQSEDSHDHIITGIPMIYESLPQNSEAAVGNADRSPSEDLRGNCLIEELMIGKDKLPQSVDREFHNEIQTSDARIRRWSNGKEGNIRSLLSTLQYWMETGALVNIIEGNAVRRTYQKALLCLHPDKLQQKGAAPHQKYIAERVFDILQEAWTQFSSLGSF